MWAERSELREVGDVSLFVDVIAPPPRLIDVRRGRLRGRALPAGARGRLAARSCSTRARGSPRRERFPDAEEVIVAWPEEAFARLGGIDRATYIAVLTHDPKLDDAALAIALRSEARVRRRDGQPARAGEAARAAAGAGIDEELLARVAAPIGLDLGALTAEETALSIMAEVVAVRNGREGGRLSQPPARIHEVGA